MRGRASRVLALSFALAAAAAAARAAVPPSGTVELELTPLDIWPPAPVADVSASAGAEGRITVRWTAPHEDAGVVPSGNAPASYELRLASYTVAGGTTAWWAAASTAAAPAPLAPGAEQSIELTGLSPGVTYYFALRSVDESANVSPLDVRSAAGSPASAWAAAVAPGRPSDVSAVVASTSAILVSWTDLPASEKGADFAGYRIYRAPAPQGPFTAIAVTLSASLLDTTAQPGVRYFYHVAAFDLLGLESVLSDPAAEDIATAPPATPHGLVLELAGSSITARWLAVVRYLDGRPFANAASPSIDELTFYEVHRSTSEGLWATVASLPPSTLEWTGPDIGVAAYRIVAAHGLARSAPSNQVGRGGEIEVLAGSATLTIPAELASLLDAETNSIGRDIDVVGRRNDASIGGAVFESVTFEAFADGVDLLPSFSFPEPLLLEIPYRVVNGVIVPASTGSGAQAAPQATIPAPQAAESLGVYWFNGDRFVKLYGRIDTAAQVARVRTPVLGTFQIRPLARSQGVEFELNGLSGRIVTPNGDGLNDLLRFTLSNPRDSFVAGKVYDLTGAFVSDMGGVGPCDSTGCVLTWDGRSGGAAAASGVYVYEIRAEDKVFNGTVVVAR